MIYVMSDLHGCYKQYIQALETIRFNDDDTLFVLGDVVDRGPEPITILQDMMLRSNVFPILGNHEFSALTVLSKLNKEITDHFLDQLSEEDLMELQYWINDGGDTTLKQFLQLDHEERQDVLEYLSEFSLIEEIDVNHKTYVLVHAGLSDFDIHKDIYDYELQDLIFKSPDYDRIYFPDKILVTGHTPTLSFNQGIVYQKNHHLSIDCGCVFGGKLAVCCLNTEEIYYIE